MILTILNRCIHFNSVLKRLTFQCSSALNKVPTRSMGKKKKDDCKFTQHTAGDDRFCAACFEKQKEWKCPDRMQKRKGTCPDRCKTGRCSNRKPK